LKNSYTGLVGNIAETCSPQDLVVDWKVIFSYILDRDVLRKCFEVAQNSLKCQIFVNIPKYSRDFLIGRISTDFSKKMHAPRS